MKVLVHDFGGYPFSIQLSRELADRGHRVMHAFCGSLKTTPGGDHQKRESDPEQLEIAPLYLRGSLEKYSFVKRWRQENEYGGIVVKQTQDFRPDVVVSANTPLDAQNKLQKFCKANGIPFVFWLQDVLSVATDRLLRRKLPMIGRMIGSHYIRMESSILRRSDLTLFITDDFRPLLQKWGVSDSKCMTFENWAPLDELPVREKNNAWARANGLSDKQCVVYTGTLGMKHNPDLLLRLALRLRDQPESRVVVVSEGLGASWLNGKAKEFGLKNIKIFNYGPFEQIPDIMGTADVLTAVLEPDAGTYSVPSKVLAYLCAGRPVVLAMPSDNLAARIVTSNHAGVCIDPNDTADYVRVTVDLLNEPSTRQQMGLAGRRYAEQSFGIQKIADGFEANLSRICSG